MKKQYQKMTITAVPLKPEQAVLSCCESSGKGVVTGTNQCGYLICTGIWQDSEHQAS